MRVYVQPTNFLRYLDVYIFSGSFPERLLVFKGPGETGTHEFAEVEITEGVMPETPSFTLDTLLVKPLVDALTNYMPTAIDQSVLDNLASERARVDKLLDTVIELAKIPPVIVTERGSI